MPRKNRKLEKELKQFFKNQASETKWRSIGDENTSLDSLDVILFGPPDTPYENW